jgi:hypothetical protein
MDKSTFLKLAAVAACVTALTTLGVHFISFSADTFEERLLLGRDPLYVFQKWMIVAHAHLVIVSMVGAATVAAGHNKGAAMLSTLFFAVFGITESARMLMVIAWLSPMKEKYLAATDTVAQQMLRLQMESFGQLSIAMFLLFILAFSLGNLFMGLALPKAEKTDRWMARGFLFWAALTLLAFANHFWENAAAEAIVEANNKFFQPAFRAAIGWWLWRKARAE